VPPFGSVRFQYDLDAVVLLISKRRVTLRRLAQGHMVRDYETRVNVAVLNPPEERL
jgi:hypothetical protein